MPTPQVTLGTPPLRTKWQDAKKKSEEAAGKSKETSKLSDLQKKKLKASLGPDLDAWPKNYPDWSKLQSKKAAIDKTIDSYADAVKKSGLTDPVTKPMATALKEIKDAMETRLELAHDLINADLKLGLKMSKKAISPIILFQQDVAKNVADKAGKTRLHPDKIELEIILSDDKVIKNVPMGVDNGLLAQKIREKASFSTIIDQLANLLKSVDKLDVKAAEHKFEEGMDTIIEKALERAAEPILELVEVRSDYRMYKIKKGATLTVATLGVIASTASLAASPFTGGVSTVAGIIGIVKSIHTISNEAAKLALTAEESIRMVTSELKTLYKQYQTASSTTVGSGELAKVTVNSLVGPFFTTIKSCKEDAEDAESKNKGLIVKANDQAEELDKLLKGQHLFQQQLSAYEHSAKTTLNKEEIAQLLKVKQKYDASARPIDTMIKSITALDKRTENNKGALVMVKNALTPLAQKEPVWSKVGQILVQIGSSAAFMIAGGVNVPEPMESVKLIKEVAENSSRAIESLEAVKEAAEGLNDLIKHHK